MNKYIYISSWKNDKEGGVFLNNQWLQELELNSKGFFVVAIKDIYLGHQLYKLKYQDKYYLMNDGSYREYSYIHSRGYSEYPSEDKYYLNKDNKAIHGYYNSSDGYYVEGVWHNTIEELNSAGYIIIE